MDPRLRFWLIVSLGTLLGVATAFGIAEESYALAVVTAGGVFWLVAEWRGGPRPEAWVLAAALLGYVLANRGFAQLSLVRQLPLLPAEIALGAGLAALVLRMALRQSAALFRDGLNLAILAWVALGTVHLWPDFRAHGAMALRDFATVYYALFFFVAQALARHAALRALLQRALVLGCAVLPFSYFLFTRFGEFFMARLVFRGAPLVFYKDDLVAAYFFAGFFLLLGTAERPARWRVVLAVAAYASAFTINSSRAAIMGLLVACAAWAVARRWRPLRVQLWVTPAGLLALLLLALVQPRPLAQSRIYALFEHVASMVDVTGRRSYTSEERRYVGDNNRFRLAWWRSVIDETREQGPWFGLGFGADLTERFVRTYENDLGDDFNTRSPHSIVFTVLGCMGVTGLIAWLAVMLAAAARTLRAARMARDDPRAVPVLAWWSASGVLLTSACLGVVLEGPMGAVVFWTMLGLANAGTTELACARATAPAESEAEAEPETSPASAALPP